MRKIFTVTYYRYQAFLKDIFVISHWSLVIGDCAFITYFINPKSKIHNSKSSILHLTSSIPFHESELS
jgi:hypothetical protein